MNPDTSSVEGALEIDKVRGPFRNVVPTKIMKERDETKERLLLAGSPEMKAEFPRMRAEMLQQVFEVFVTRQDEIESCCRTLKQHHADSLPALFVAIMSVFESSVRYAAANVPAFIRTLQQYDIGHNGRGFALGERSGAGELVSFATHGTGVMMGLYRVVPQVFFARYGRMPSAEELRELIPECADRMFSALTRVKGPYAVDVEEQMGMSRHFYGYEDSTYAFPEFSPRSFVLRTVEGKHVLDVTEDVTARVHRNVRAPSTAFHGCLAGLVKIPQTEEDAGPPPTVFAFMRKFTAELMHRHVFPDACA